MTRVFVDAETILARNFVAPPAPILETPRDPARRALMARSAALGLGLAGATLLGACSDDDGQATFNPGTGTQPLGDADILNFALNLEYLEAEFYSRAVLGMGLTADMTSGSGTVGTVTGGSQVAFETNNVRQYAKEITHNERTHVALLRNTLGSAGIQPIARPSIDLQNSFTNLFRTAGIIGANESFNPFSSENNFLLGAFIFEDVGVTAYKGAAKLLTSKAYLEASAGILAAEAYHAAIVRIVLYTRGFDPSNSKYDASLIDKVNRISDARDAVDGTTTTTTGTTADDDQGLSRSGTAPNDTSNLVPTDSNSIAFGRNADKVLNVAYLTASAATSGGFFPGGVNGRINASTAASS